MGIFDTPQPTHEELIQIHKKRIVQSNVRGFQELIDSLKTSFDFVWNPPNDITVQEVMDSFGTEAYKLFETHAAVNTLIQVVDPTYEPLVPPYQFTINQDGTVTINQ